MKEFRVSILISVIGLALAFFWGGTTGVILTAILAIMEISLSFDNAVVNASVLQEMDEKWQTRFLTWGMIIAVFGMRLVFPILIVALITGQGFVEVAQMALHSPDEYAKHLTSSHIQISAFGGMFLLLVFLSFLFDEERELHWLGLIERKLGAIGKMESVEVIAALGILLTVQSFLPLVDRLAAVLSGVAGVILFVLVSSLSGLFENEAEGEAAVQTAKNAGLMSFLYLEVLDASFSFDGVIGAFAITKDVVIIMVGLAIGAMFVRSLTIFLVHKGTLSEYVYLEHGAHYAIGALAFIMLLGMLFHIPEVVTGLIGVAFIGLSVMSSVKHNRLHVA